MKHLLSALIILPLLTGCANYRWTSNIPQDMRTVAVPTFRNESNVQELGAVATRQLLREFQREGTLKIKNPGDSAIEVQGVIKSGSTGGYIGDRRTGARLKQYDYRVTAVVSVIDKRAGRVLIDNKTYTAETEVLTNSDVHTARRDASGRVADDLARQIVDDVISMQW